MLISKGCLHVGDGCAWILSGLPGGGDVRETGLKLASRLLLTGVVRLRGFVALVADRFVRHEGAQNAAALTYTTLLSLVPLMAAISRQVVEDSWRQYCEELSALRFGWRDTVRVLLYDCRFSLSVAVLAGLGRAMSEVGAVMIVGGNIDRSTRVMTTAIALETSKGDLPLAIALGMVLLVLILLLNAGAFALRTSVMRRFE